MSDDRKNRALKGKTLVDEWRESTGPPTNYGQPDPRTVLEVVGSVCWVWNTANADAEIHYDGSPVEVKQ